MPSQDPQIAQELLSHQSFLRRLAVDLVGSDADDLVQDVWERALKRPPTDGRQLRGWLARVARNLAANRWRDDSRRRLREEHVGCERPSVESLEERHELRKELVEALDSLSPTYREVILLRYFEGLPPRDIAQRCEVPVATVKKRLQRGLEQLREALDRQNGGDRSTWMSAVSALVAPVDSGSGSSSLLIGGIAMGAMLKISAAVLVGVVGVYFVTRDSEAESDDDATLAPPSEGAELAESERLLAVESTDVAADARSPVVSQYPRAVVSSVNARVLRVVLEGIEPESASMGTVTVTALREGLERSEQIEKSWSLDGVTSEFGVDAILRGLSEQPSGLVEGELEVVVNHPLHFSESVTIPLFSGVEEPNGQTVYSAFVRFADAVYWPELAFSVRDAHTREHLRDVELRCAPTAFMGLVQQPGTSGAFTVIGSGLSSPIGMRGGRRDHEPEDRAAGLALEPKGGGPLMPAEFVQSEEVGRGVMVYARAPGYAWGRLVLDVSKGSERELLLERAAALSVRVVNVQPERYAELGKRATLFVRKVGPDGVETTAWSRELDGTWETEALRIESLESGDYVALVELSSSWRRKPMELGRAAIAIPPGGERELPLILPDAPEAPGKATLSGVVSFPNFGGKEHVRLEFYGSDYRYGDPDFELRLDELVPVNAAAPTWSFRAEGLPVDRYQVRLLPFQKSWMVALPDGGRDDVELVIPELAEVLVETVDAETGQGVSLETIGFRTMEALPDQVTHGGSGPWSWVEPDTEPGRFRFWTTPGGAAVIARGKANGVDYGHFPEEVQLVPGLQSMRIELAPACILRFEFRVDGAALPHEDGIFVGLSECIRAIGHDGRVGGLYPYSLVEASAPGLYEVTFEGVGSDRFLPIPPRRVEVTAGGTTEVIVELRSK